MQGRRPSCLHPQAPADVQHAAPQQRILMGQRRTLQLDDDPDDVPEELPDADPDVPPMHEPLTQVPPANVQLLQSEPPVPHAVSDCPGSHSELVLQQPAAQLVDSHPTVPPLPLPPTSLLLPPPLPTLPLAPALLVPLDVPSPEALPLPPPTLLTSEPLPLPTPLPVVRPVSIEDASTRLPPPASKSP